MCWSLLKMKRKWLNSRAQLHAQVSKRRCRKCGSVTRALARGNFWRRISKNSNETNTIQYMQITVRNYLILLYNATTIGIANNCTLVASTAGSNILIDQPYIHICEHRLSLHRGAITISVRINWNFIQNKWQCFTRPKIIIYKSDYIYYYHNIRYN